ncbi:MAG: DUF1667 domain-containing protein [Spirochaetaceae bacterium]|jgi:CxxC motif-containing protein|nr:DUF1667 domain-containing protein [Spirochaetaceae bacterium]
MRSLTCIVCPVGCSLTVSAEPALAVAGNACPRGAVYAQEEIRAPKRVVTATCALSPGPHGLKRLPVKTAQACPKALIRELLADLYRLTLQAPLKAGDVIIPDWRGTGVNVVAARTIG